MFTIDAKELVAVRNGLAREATLIPTFLEYRDRRHTPIQRRYFTEGRVDGRGTVSRSTARARASRWGYYRRGARFGAGSTGPYGLWTGNLMQHTTAERGRVRIRTGFMTFSFGLRRGWLRNPWDLVPIDRALGEVGTARFARVFRSPGRRAS